MARDGYLCMFLYFTVDAAGARLSIYFACTKDFSINFHSKVYLFNHVALLSIVAIG